ncbi:FKBP-type peptidyl-prolyl cis-trans isomerase [Pseudomonas phoenicis]|uniref:FKBP-type peptidyl-prolyl cis-trans isomerase n=1 Tax=unclassified Pseudomonas TaxID=196821 RepID=UPI00399FAEB5
MSRHPMFALCLFMPLAAVAADTQQTDRHDLAYSLGASLGERLRQEVPDLQIEALLEGLGDTYRGQPPKLDQARMQGLLEQHEAQAAALAEQARIDQAQASEQRFMTEQRARPGTQALAKGVLYEVLTPGTGAQPQANGRVQVRYVGRLPDGSVFDQSHAAQWFNLSSVIEGWQVALPAMQVGAKWRLVVPSPLAYGAEGAGDLIAPYTPLVFEIELLDVAG